MSGGAEKLTFAAALSGGRALLPVLLQLLILLLAVWIDPYILKKQRRIMTLIALLVLSIVAENIVAAWLETDVCYPFARTVESIYGYSVRPVVMVLFFYIISPDREYKPFWWLIGLNAAVYLTALFSPAAFSITPDNRFVRGPLCYTAFIVSAVLLLYLLYLSLREWNRAHRAEALIPVVNALLITGAVAMDSFIVHTQSGLTYLTVTMVSCCLFFYIWLHLRFVRDHEDALMMRQRVQIMLSQIQPHFLYNTLGAIREICGDLAAKKAIGRFTRYLQGNMDALTKPGTIPFAVELEHTKAYLELEQLRFESALCVVYDISCTDFELPTLTLQPIAENAVRHGARGTERDVGTVTIATREFQDRYEVTVTDDGPGFDPERLTPKDDGRAHIGIQNVRERLRNICAGELRIESEIGKGTRVTLLLPKQKPGI